MGMREDYVGKHGNAPVPNYGSPGWTQEWQDDWDALTNRDKTFVKQERPIYQPPGAREEGLTEDWYGKARAGPDLNIWKGLSEILGIPGRDIKRHFIKMYTELTERPDFGEEYGLRTEDLERSLSGSFAARGMLDSSAMASALGTGTAGLMKERAMMEETAWMNRLGRARGLRGEGFGFAEFLNKQFLQDLGLDAKAIAYLSGERERQNLFELQRYGIDPNPYDPMTTMEGALGIGTGLAGIYSAAAGGGGFGGYDWGAPAGGGGGQTDFPDPNVIPPWD